jgi:hypothetical protein
VLFVRLTAPPGVLEKHHTNPSPQQLDKLLDGPRSRERLGSFDRSVFYEDDLTVDTRPYTADAVALTIKVHIARSDTDL